ncbi:MAG: HNH endonuclease [Oscillospiraceae bacterium]|jgi:5-methylcytosine-specific restriction endonuclease McrA|nr:HNH endonuclease [Oscillospiraceae bacterium]
MREWAAHIYKSKQWRYEVRPYIIDRDNGLCVRCGEPGNIVHHIIHLTPLNVNDPLIAFGEGNLELTCSKCHGSEHGGEPATDGDLMFDDFGELVPAHRSNE